VKNTAMPPAIKFIVRLVAICFAVPSALAVGAMAIAWLIWPLILSLAGLKYLFS